MREKSPLRICNRVRAAERRLDRFINLGGGDRAQRVRGKVAHGGGPVGGLGWWVEKGVRRAARADAPLFNPNFPTPPTPSLTSACPAGTPLCPTWAPRPTILGTARSSGPGCRAHIVAIDDPFFNFVPQHDVERVLQLVCFDPNETRVSDPVEGGVKGRRWNARRARNRGRCGSRQIIAKGFAEPDAPLPEERLRLVRAQGQGARRARQAPQTPPISLVSAPGRRSDCSGCTKLRLACALPPPRTRSRARRWEQTQTTLVQRPLPRRSGKQ